jgi:DNA polymerase-3 subunit beta
LLLPTNFIKEIIYKLSNITSPLGKDNYYPVLKGILIDGARVDAQVEAISTDGVHLIYIKTPFNGSKFKIIVNAAIFKYITDLIDLDKEIIFYVQKNNLIIQIKDFLFSCRLIEGDYPSSIKAIEETKEFKFIVDKRKFINALEKGLIVGGGEKKPSIALQINVNKLKLTSRSVEWGSSYEELDIEGYTGDNIRLLLNIKTLSNLIKNIESEKIEFRFSNNAKPIAVLDQSNPNYFSIIMPIRNN